MNKKIFLLSVLSFSLAFAGCKGKNKGNDQQPSGGDQTPAPAAKEIWEEDLVEGESTFAQVKAGEAGQYYKVRGTVAANSGSTLSLYRGGEFLYCYNFNADQENNGGHTGLEAHPLGSYVELYAQSSAYSGSVQMTAYDVGEQKTDKKYDRAAYLHKLADKGETVTPKVATTAEDFANSVAAGAMLKVSFEPDSDYTLDPANTSSNQDVIGLVGETQVELRLEKYLPADVRTALLDEAHQKFEMKDTYEVVALAAATSSMSVRLLIAEGASWTRTAQHQWDAPTSVDVTAFGGADSLEVGQELELLFTVSPNTAKPLVSWVSENETVATVNKDGVVKGKAVGNVTIRAYAANSETVNGMISLEVKAPSKTVTMVKVPAANTEYLAGIHNASAEGDFFLDGTKSSWRLATTSNPENAITVKLIPVEGKDGKFYFQCKIGEDTKYLNTSVDGGNVNMDFEATASTEYSLYELQGQDGAKTITFEVEGCTTASKNGTTYFGNNGGSSNTKVQNSRTTYLEGDYVSKIDQANGQYPLHFYTYA